MKKKLEADLISIAHRILKLKNKSDINQLYLETQKLYEKLAILKFVEENFDAVKPTIGHSDINAEIETIFEKEGAAILLEEEVETPVAIEEVEIEKAPEPVIVEQVAEEIVFEELPEVIEEIVEETVQIEEEPEVLEEPQLIEETETVEEIKLPFEEISFTTVSDLKPIPNFKPAFELTEERKEEPKEEVKAVEEIKEVTVTKPNPVQIMFEDLGINYADAQFVKVDSFEAVKPTAVIPDFKENKTVETAVIETAEPKATTLNEKLGKGFHVDLNDRIAFTKNLFGNSSEDYSRVLNQLLTFDTFSEAKEFIENMVKPDYNNWEGKDDYAERFLGIIEKKFS